MEAEDQIRLCKRCGERTISRGYETYANEPHKRKKYTCVSCGHTSPTTVNKKEDCKNYVA